MRFTRRDGLIHVVGEFAEPSRGRIWGTRAGTRHRGDIDGVSGNQGRCNRSLRGDFSRIHSGILPAQAWGEAFKLDGG